MPDYNYQQCGNYERVRTVLSAGPPIVYGTWGGWYEIKSPSCASMQSDAARLGLQAQRAQYEAIRICSLPPPGGAGSPSCQGAVTTAQAANAAFNAAYAQWQSLCDGKPGSCS